MPFKLSVSSVFGKVLVCAGMVMAGAVAQAAPTYVASFGGSDYYVTDRASNWTTAEAAGVSIGGHLVTINSLAEQNFLAATFPTTNGTYWIGFNDAAVEGTFAWSSGEAVTYTNWAGGEPNDFFGEDYTVMNWSGVQWNDLPDVGYDALGILEVRQSTVPEPSGLALVALALIGLGASRRRKS